MTIFKKIFLGYAKLIIVLIPYFLLIVGIFSVSFVTSFALWYTSTTFTNIFSIIVIILIAAGCAYFLLNKLIRKKLFGNILNFTGLVLELFLIIYFYSNKMNLIVPAIILSVEYLLFLGITFGLDHFLERWMKLILIILTIGTFSYSTALFYKEGVYLICIPLSIFYLLAFGYILNQFKKRTNISQKR